MRVSQYLAPSLLLSLCILLIASQSGFAAGPPAISELARLSASDGSSNDLFGSSVAASGNTVVVGASSARGGVGAAYVFVQPAGGWTNMTETAELTPSDGTPSDNFGFSVAISGNVIVVGAPYANNFSGGVYVFVEPAGGWINMTETAKLDDARPDELGWSVAISGSVVATGSEFRNASYVFVEPAGGWKTTSNINAELTSFDSVFNDYFGYSIATTGKEIVVGAIYATFNDVAGPGAAYVYFEPSGGWKTTSTYNAKLTASDGVPSAEFGRAVSAGGAAVMVGAPFTTVGSNQYQGTGYVFVAPRGRQTETAEIISSAGTAESQFGTSVSSSVNGKAGVFGSPNYFSTFGSAYI